jgi:small subunit ribosomal protein S20
MAKRIKSGLKRRRQDEARRLRNRAVRTRLRHAIRDLRSAIAEGDGEKAAELLPQTISVIDVSVRKGVVHRNLASRTKSRLSLQVHGLSQTARG